MVTIVFDIFQFAERLKAAGVPAAQAKAEPDACAEVLSLVDVATLRDFRSWKRL